MEIGNMVKVWSYNGLLSARSSRPVFSVDDRFRLILLKNSVPAFTLSAATKFDLSDRPRIDDHNTTKGMKTP